MTKKRIVPCLDIRDGKVVKGRNFEGIQEVDDPVKLAALYSSEGASELVFYDITASTEGRMLFVDLMKRVLEVINVPLIAGGGIATLEDIDLMFKCGAKKVSINSGALKRPEIIADAAREFGSERVILSMDVKIVDGKYTVFSKGGQVSTGLDALEWAKKGEQNGAGEIVLNSIDTDGVKEGFDLPMLKAVSDLVDIPVIASGGAGGIEHFIDLFNTLPRIDVGLAASIFHFREVNIKELKDKLVQAGFEV